MSGLKDDVKKDSVKGIRTIVEREIHYVRNHDKIVGKLEELLKQKGLKTHYTREIDILTKEGNKATKVFEIKTDISSSSLQKAVGQLILYTLDLDEKPDLFLVLPDQIDSKKQAKLLKQLNIDVIVFNLKGDSITFQNLDEKI